MTRTRRTALLAAAYIGTIIAANLLTAWVGMVGIGAIAVTMGTFAIGFSFVARDALNESDRRRRVVLTAIAAGAVLSAVLTYTLTDHPEPLRLAAASGLACLAAESGDMRVFTWLRERFPLAARVASNLVAAPIDSLLFLWIAGFPLEGFWLQFLVKAVVGVATPWLIARLRTWREGDGAVLRDTLHRASA